MPIGNLTSQLFANIYLNALDQFVKHRLKVKYYVRYTDDFVIVSESRPYLESLISPIQDFLRDPLHLSLHPKKVNIRKFRHGIDFLGYVLLPHHRVVRTKTKRRMIRKLHQRMAEYHQGLIDQNAIEQSVQSYLGVLSHADAFGLSEEVKNAFWV